MSTTNIDIYQEIDSNCDDLQKVVSILRQEGKNAKHLAKEKDEEFGRLPIHYAIQFGGVGVLDLVKELVRIFPECVKMKSNADRFPIHYLNMRSCRVKDDPEEFFKTAKYLVEIYPEALDENNILGNLPLHCQHNSIKLVRYLINKYPDWIKTQEGDGNLPMHYFCEKTNTDAQNDILELCLDVYPDGIFVKNARGRTLIDEISCQDNSKRFLALTKAYKRMQGASYNDHLISRYLQRNTTLSKKHLKQVNLFLKHYDCILREHDDNNERIKQVEEDLQNEKHNFNAIEAQSVQLKSQVEELIRRLQTEKNCITGLQGENKNLQVELDQNKEKSDASEAEWNRQLDVEKKRVMELRTAHDTKIQNMVHILQSRKLEFGLLTKVLENNESRPLGDLLLLATDMHTRLSKMRGRVLPQEAPSSAQFYFGFVQKTYRNGGEPDRGFLLQVLKDINDELFELEEKRELEEKHGISADDDVVIEAADGVSVGNTRPLEGGTENDSPPKCARTITSVSISPG